MSKCDTCIHLGREFEHLRGFKPDNETSDCTDLKWYDCRCPLPAWVTPTAVAKSWIENCDAYIKERRKHRVSEVVQE